MLSKKQQVGKLYGVRSVVDGMISALDSEVLTFEQCIDTVAAHIAKAIREYGDSDLPPQD